MFDNVLKFFKKFSKDDKKESKDTAKERLHLVLMQDRANVSADFMELMKQEIIEVIKKYIDVDENSIDVKLTNKVNGDGTTGVPMLYANIPIMSVKDDAKQVKIERNSQNKQETKKVEEPEKKETEKQSEETKKVDNSKKDDLKENKEEKEEDNKEEQKQEDISENVEKGNEDSEEKEEVIKEDKLENDEDSNKTEVE